MVSVDVDDVEMVELHDEIGAGHDLACFAPGEVWVGHVGAAHVGLGVHAGVGEERFGEPAVGGGVLLVVIVVVVGGVNGVVGGSLAASFCSVVVIIVAHERRGEACQTRHGRSSGFEPSSIVVQLRGQTAVLRILQLVLVDKRRQPSPVLVQHISNCFCFLASSQNNSQLHVDHFCSSMTSSS